MCGLNRPQPFPGELGGESLQFLEVLSREAFQPLSSLVGKVQTNHSLIGCVPRSLYEAGLVRPIDQTDHAVMAEEEIVRHFADRRTPGVGVPPDSQEQLMLCGRQPGCFSLLLAPSLKMAKTGPQRQQSRVHGIRQTQS